MFGTELNKETLPISLKYILKINVLLITLFLIIIIIYGIKFGIFQDENLFIKYIKDFGLLAPICFILLQIIQVIIPIIPGGISCLAGVLVFGPILGFIYNYVGLIIGSCIAFLLAKKYGLKLIKKLFKEVTINKYLKYIKEDYFYRVFVIGIFLPFLPDDLLCYIAGLTQIKFKRFLIIILLGKPITLLSYSIFMELL